MGGRGKSNQKLKKKQAHDKEAQLTGKDLKIHREVARSMSQISRSKKTRHDKIVLEFMSRNKFDTTDALFEHMYQEFDSSAYERIVQQRHELIRFAKNHLFRGFVVGMNETTKGAIIRNRFKLAEVGGGGTELRDNFAADSIDCYQDARARWVCRNVRNFLSDLDGEDSIHVQIDDPISAFHAAQKKLDSASSSSSSSSSTPSLLHLSASTITSATSSSSSADGSGGGGGSKASIQECIVCLLPLRASEGKHRECAGDESHWICKEHFDDEIYRSMLQGDKCICGADLKPEEDPEETLSPEHLTAMRQQAAERYRPMFEKLGIPRHLWDEAYNRDAEPEQSRRISQNLIGKYIAKGFRGRVKVPKPGEKWLQGTTHRNYK